MANRMDRFKAMYSKIVRPDVATPFPKHVFVRAANANGDNTCRKANRFNGKEVYLVGSVNQSTMLAQRTQKLISEVKPDAVMVQTSEKWWETAKLLQYVDSQEEFKNYDKHLDKYTSFESFDFYKATRAPIFWARFYMYCFLFKFHFRIPQNFTFLKPGIEQKFACEEAEKLGAKTYFLGAELNMETWQRLYHETRMNLPQYVWRRAQYQGMHSWAYEKMEATGRLHNSEPHQFAERVLDPYQMNWYIQSLDIFFPKFKRIFIDQRGYDLFKSIDSCPEKKIVVVVNQWHMECIEHYWAHRYGQMPRSVDFPEGIDVIGDMDLQNGLFQRLYNALHREIASAQTGGTPATYADWIIGYHRESNWQYEHRDM